MDKWEEREGGMKRGGHVVKGNPHCIRITYNILLLLKSINTLTALRYGLCSLHT